MASYRDDVERTISEMFRYVNSEEGKGLDRHLAESIARGLREGRKTAEICMENGISEHTYYRYLNPERRLRDSEYSRNNREKHKEKMPHIDVWHREDEKLTASQLVRRGFARDKEEVKIAAAELEVEGIVTVDRTKKGTYYRLNPDNPGRHLFIQEQGE